MERTERHAVINSYAREAVAAEENKFPIANSECGDRNNEKE
jgi:hypothetical protein